MSASYPLSEGARRSADIVQRQLDAYNARDIERFLAFYSDDIVLSKLGGAPMAEGKAAVSRFYADIFATYPANRAVVKNRIALGVTVIDHEDVTRGPGLERFEILAVYTIAGDKIVRVDFRREQG